MSSLWCTFLRSGFFFCCIITSTRGLIFVCWLVCRQGKTKSTEWISWMEDGYFQIQSWRGYPTTTKLNRSNQTSLRRPHDYGGQGTTEEARCHQHIWNTGAGQSCRGGKGVKVSAVLTHLFLHAWWWDWSGSWGCPDEPVHSAVRCLENRSER